ncbi:MAG: hypothetical protein QXH21_09170 [Ignisphaera sp.]
MSLESQFSDNIDDSPPYGEHYAIIADIYAVYNTGRFIRGLKDTDKPLIRRLTKSLDREIMDHVRRASTILDVHNEIVLHDAYSIVKSIVRGDMSDGTISDIALVAVYLCATSRGVYVDYNELREMIDERKLLDYIKLVKGRLKLSVAKTTEMYVAHYASKLKMDNREYAKTLQLALDLSKLIGARKAAILSTYIVYNTYSLLNHRPVITAKTLGNLLHKIQVKKVTVKLGS